MPSDAVELEAQHRALALHGGHPVRAQWLPYGHHAVTEADIQAVAAVLRSDYLTTGPTVAKFEAAFAASVGAQEAVAFSSGTAALHAAAWAAGLAPGDEALTVPLTFCATANCVLYQGATPVFVDVMPDTLLIDPQQAARGITGRTKALLPVDYAGQPVDMTPLQSLADRHGLVIIEDACHALGASAGGRQVGSRSHMTVFSCHPVKHITTGEGGLVTTDQAAYAQRLRRFRNHGIEGDAATRDAHRAWYYEMVELGYNYRLSDLGCALGLSQLQRLPAFLARRRAIAERYTAAFRRLAAVTPLVVRPEVQHAWHLYPLQLQLERLRGGRADILQALRAENIGASVHFIPVHLHPYYRQRFGYRGGECPVAEAAYERLISLPLFPAMTEVDVRDVIAAVEKVVTHYAR